MSTSFGCLYLLVDDDALLGLWGPQCGLCVSWSYKDKVSERWKIAVHSGSSKLYAILPNLIAQRVTLDLAKHYHVPLCKLYEHETSILLLAMVRFYSPGRRPKDIREVRDEERLVTLLVWGYNDEAGSWEPTPSQLPMSPSGEDISILTP